jgi:hypothetical protein
MNDGAETCNMAWRRAGNVHTHHCVQHIVENHRCACGDMAPVRTVSARVVDWERVAAFHVEGVGYIDKSDVRAVVADAFDEGEYVLLRRLSERTAALGVAESERDHWKHKAEDFEGRYETSHASRMWAEECFRRAESERDAALARIAAVEPMLAYAQQHMPKGWKP